MTIITDYIAFGTSLANMTNIQLAASEAAVLLTREGGKPMPLLGSVSSELVSGGSTRDGRRNAVLVYPSLYRDEFNALVLAIWGDFTTANKRGYISMPDESGHYSPFRVDIVRPVIDDDYEVTINLTPVDVRIAVNNGILQAVSKTSNFTHTTSERLALVSTAGGNVTATLAAASSYTPHTIYSFVKVGASNDLVIDPNSSETIGGASTLTMTADRDRADIYTDGSAWYRLSA